MNTLLAPSVAPPYEVSPSPMTYAKQGGGYFVRESFCFAHTLGWSSTSLACVLKGGTCTATSVVPPIKAAGASSALCPAACLHSSVLHSYAVKFGKLRSLIEARSKQRCLLRTAGPKDAFRFAAALQRRGD